MSLNLSESLNCLAMAQGALVMPELGESYAGKSAAAVAGLLVMLATGLEARVARRAELGARLAGLLGAEPGAGLEALMERLSAELPLAEREDPARAALLLDWLVDWAESERLELPPPA